jgi:hypothetical protein
MPKMKLNPLYNIPDRGRLTKVVLRPKRTGVPTEVPTGKIHKIVTASGGRAVPLCMQWKAQKHKSYRPGIFEEPGRGEVTCYRCMKMLINTEAYPGLKTKTRYFPSRMTKAGRKRLEHVMVMGGNERASYKSSGGRKGKRGKEVRRGQEVEWAIGPTLEEVYAAYGYKGARPTQSKKGSKKALSRSGAQIAQLVSMAMEMAEEGKVTKSKGGKRLTAAEARKYGDRTRAVANPKRRKRKSTKRKTGTQTKAQANAKKAMKLYHSGKARSLKAAWRMVKKGK